MILRVISLTEAEESDTLYSRAISLTVLMFCSISLTFFLRKLSLK